MDAQDPAVDPVALLERALDQTARLIDSVRDDQGSLPTPCRSWDVRALVGHLLGDLDRFTERARGETPDWSLPPPQPQGPPHRWAAEFRERGASLLATWRDAGDLTGTITIPGMGEVPARFHVEHQVIELGIHAWDLKRAVGADVDLDTAVSTTGLTLTRAMFRDEFRGDEADGKGFGREVPVPADAPVEDRLAAFTGRDPSWRPPNPST